MTTPLKMETLSLTSSASKTESQAVWLSLSSKAIRLERFNDLNVLVIGRVLIRCFGFKNGIGDPSDPREEDVALLETEATY